MEKQSPVLGRNAQYKKSSRLSRLPGYLTVQLVRFFVGKAGDSEEFVSKKILKVCFGASHLEILLVNCFVIAVGYQISREAGLV